MYVRRDYVARRELLSSCSDRRRVRPELRSDDGYR